MNARDKIKTWDELRRIRADARGNGRKVVFTNGCFEILHPGHVRYLEAARALGDILVVAVNADDSARRLSKGAGRPYTSAATRSEMVAALTAVDYVTLFDQDTPRALIAFLVPDVLVKGGDWRPEQIVGAAEVKAAGGEVRALPFEPGFSTTALIAKIQRTTQDG